MNRRNFLGGLAALPIPFLTRSVKAEENENKWWKGRDFVFEGHNCVLFELPETVGAFFVDPDGKKLDCHSYYSLSDVRNYDNGLYGQMRQVISFDDNKYCNVVCYENRYNHFMIFSSRKRLKVRREFAGGVTIEQLIHNQKETLSELDKDHQFYDSCRNHLERLEINAKKTFLLDEAKQFVERFH